MTTLYKRRYSAILEYVSIFNALENMDHNKPRKLGIHDGKLYVGTRFGEGLYRRLYGESRNTFIDFVENTILNIEAIVNICIEGYSQLDKRLQRKYSSLFLWLQSKLFLWMEKLDGMSVLYQKDTFTISRFSKVLKLCYDLMIRLDDYNTVELIY